MCRRIVVDSPDSSNLSDIQPWQKRDCAVERLQRKGGSFCGFPSQPRRARLSRTDGCRGAALRAVCSL